jgi:hypothetical protein
MSKAGRWQAMGDLVDDDVLTAFAVVGEPDQLAPKLMQRFGDVADRMCMYVADGNMEPLEVTIDELLAAS